MISLFLVALAAAPSAGAIDSARSSFVSCLKQVASTAKPPAVTADTFATYAAQQCAAQQSALRDAMIAFDVKNGASRKSAAEGADFAVEDYLATAKGNFEARNSN